MTTQRTKRREKESMMLVSCETCCKTQERLNSWGIRIRSHESHDSFFDANRSHRHKDESAVFCSVACAPPCSHCAEKKIIYFRCCENDCWNLVCQQCLSTLQEASERTDSCHSSHVICQKCEE